LIEHTFARVLRYTFFAFSCWFSRSALNVFPSGSVTTVSGEPDQIEANTGAEFRAWLEHNHASTTAVWLVFWRKDSGHASIDWGDAVDQALCFGWVDSKVQSIDDKRYRQYFSVRKPGSGWSKINKEKIARLTSYGMMAAAGIAAVERAKSDGSWTILDGPEAGLVPDDLATALHDAGLVEAFDGLTVGARKAILTSLVLAKREATRANRIATTIEALADGRSPLS
jgi:uncharacterized protein YdeI (YjbR/CyaY-like superfamily)